MPKIKTANNSSNEAAATSFLAEFPTLTKIIRSPLGKFTIKRLDLKDLPKKSIPKITHKIKKKITKFIKVIMDEIKQIKNLF